MILAERYIEDLACPKCHREVRAGTARGVGDRIELVCLGCHATLATFDLEPVPDDYCCTWPECC